MIHPNYSMMQQTPAEYKLEQNAAPTNGMPYTAAPVYSHMTGRPVMVSNPIPQVQGELIICINPYTGKNCRMVFALYDIP